ncbi:hypothetical protein [Blastococcus mobilis]|uniref:Uncharacterized protein n=1 Tax=Blastococcus mobilis TaxID=1938746 RepID=A0A239AMN0_9ACTN|nr:hypothetical protein [Blastococcus mobilis]SNR96582.1 hypothetical protein SAMN06272737_14910 [Blastococcus mobilis]
MPFVSDVVRSALDTDLSPDDVARLGRQPDKVITRLEEAYADDPPDYGLPVKGSDSRPWIAYGRESAASSFWRAPTWRARAAVQMLIYSHEVAIEDPVAWYLQHPYGDREDPVRSLELLSAVAELAPLIDAGIVRCVAQRPYHPNHPRYLVYQAFSQLLFGPEHNQGTLDCTADLLQLLDLRQHTHGEVDIARHPGNDFMFDTLRRAWGRLVEDTDLLRPTEVVVPVPDITRVTTGDLIRLRQTGAFGDWREGLAIGRSAYEQALAAGSAEPAAAEAFRRELTAPALAVTRELESRSWRSVPVLGARNAGIGATGALAVLGWGWKEYVTAAVGAAGTGIAQAVVEVRRLRERVPDLVALRHHFDTFVLSLASLGRWPSATG